MKLLEYHSEEFDQPRTVCMQCAKYAQIEGVNCVEYDMACHEGRYLDNAVPMALGDPTRQAARPCRAARAHLPQGVPRELAIDDPGPRRGSETLGIEGARLGRLSTKHRGGRAEAHHRDRPRFALLVEKNAILGFNASLGTYLKAQIESLQNRIPRTPEPHEHMLQSLEHFRRSLDGYNEERRIFQGALRGICHRANCAGGPRDV